MYKYGSTPPEQLKRLRKIAQQTTALGAFGMGLASQGVDLWHGIRSIGNSIANGWQSFWASSPAQKQRAAWNKAMRDHKLAKDRADWDAKTDPYWNEHGFWYGAGKGTGMFAPMLISGGAGLAVKGAQAGSKLVTAANVANKASRAYNLAMVGIPTANVFTDNPDPFASAGPANGIPYDATTQTGGGGIYGQMSPISSPGYGGNKYITQQPY